jgi:hypothetical protein
MRIMTLTLIGLLGVGFLASQSEPEATLVNPEQVAVAASPVVVATTIMTTTTTTTTTVPDQPPVDSLCPEWWDHGENILGAADMERWDYVIYRESRCSADAFNPRDPNGGSIGLTQINRFWCIKTRYNPDGWLQAQGILSDCDDLFDPVVNLTAAHAIFRYAESRGCGWSPWSTRKTRWC